MDRERLVQVARSLVSPGKGILAADESFGTIEKRFKAIGVLSTEQTRRDYRELLFVTPGVSEFISGVILFDETIHQQGSRDVPLRELLERQGMIPGIKVDKGAKPMANFAGEKVTEGLDGLRERFSHYRELGAAFAKWRAVINIGPEIPTRTALEANAWALARYAALAQEADLVPIVEPEVLMDGSHGLERCKEVTEATLQYVYDALFEHRVFLEGTLLKPNMVIAGKDAPEQSSAQEVAEATISSLRRKVPAAVPGIVFLSGGQTDVRATENLNAMNAIGPHPWELSFSYGRALQAPALKLWQGNAANTAAAQRAFYHRAKCNSVARYGKYNEAMETEQTM